MTIAITTLIPYFGGTSSATHSKAENRRKYLARTLESVRVFNGEIVVGICDERDWFKTPSPVMLDTEPEHLASALCRWGQKNVTSSHVYVTEADQVVHAGLDIPKQAVGEQYYLVPHRLEQVYEHPDGFLVGSERGYCVKNNGKIWVLPNGVPPEGWRTAPFYTPEGRTDVFGGAFLASMNLFGRVDFLDSEAWPVEHATGWRIADTGTPLKTGMWSDFYVEHLSGYEYHRNGAK